MSEPTQKANNQEPVGACVFAENGNVRIWWTSSEMETALKWAKANNTELTLLFASPITTAYQLDLLKHRLDIVLSSPYYCTFQTLAQYVKAAKKFLLRGES